MLNTKEGTEGSICPPPESLVVLHLTPNITNHFKEKAIHERVTMCSCDDRCSRQQHTHWMNTCVSCEEMHAVSLVQRCPAALEGEGGEWGHLCPPPTAAGRTPFPRRILWERGTGVTPSHIHTCTPTHMHTCKCPHTCTHMYTCTHTHTCTRTLVFKPTSSTGMKYKTSIKQLRYDN